MTTFSCSLSDTEATIALGTRLATAVKSVNHGIVSFLNGELGAGKNHLYPWFCPRNGPSR